MLRWTHDHHRDIRALASAPCTTALSSIDPAKFAVTEHGLPRFVPAAPLLRLTLEFASSLVSNATKLALARNLHRQRHQTQLQFEHIALRPAAPTANRDFATLNRKHKYP